MHDPLSNSPSPDQQAQAAGDATDARPDGCCPVLVAALYMFARLDDLPALQQRLRRICSSAGVMGTLLLAREGINGTIAGSRAGIDAVLEEIRAVPGLAAIEHKESSAASMPFYRMKLRIKKEIVTMGVPEIDPSRGVGTYVRPADWNALISDPDVVVIDARNDYEVRIGTFEGAIDPGTRSFSELPAWLEARGDIKPRTKVAMFCTGGIRCEKATALLKSKGIDEVYHLRGGILKYLEETPEEESLWRGDCFVFDHRVAVGHGLRPGAYQLCFGCREPIDAGDMASPLYEPGICCPRCHADATDEQRRARAERQRQIAIAARQGRAHIGRK